MRILIFLIWWGVYSKIVKMNDQAQTSASKAARIQSNKYRELFLYAFLIVFLAVGLLVVNYIIANKGKEDGKLIEIAGQQRIHAGKIAKAIIEIRLKTLTDEPYVDQVRNMAEEYDQYNEIDNALRNGGVVTESSGKRIQFEPITDDSAKAIFQRIDETWNVYKEAVELILTTKHEYLDSLYIDENELVGEELESLSLAQIGEFASKQMNAMYKSQELMMSRLTEISSERAKTYQQIQVIGAILLAVVFLFSIIRVRSSLQSQDREIKRYADGLEDLVKKRTQELQASQDELKKYSDDLENLVEKRTQELQASQDELAHINENLEQLVEQRTQELRDSHTQLIQSEKMSSLGQMVAGLAHEINTPLAFVQSNVFELKSAQKRIDRSCRALYLKTHHALMDNDSGLGELLIENHSVLEAVNIDYFKEGTRLFNESYEGLERIKDLIINLKNFSRLDEADMKDTDINASLESTLKIAHNFLKHRVTVEKEYGDLPIVRCYPSQLNQVFLNLITNAAQACEKQSQSDTKGVIALRTTYTDGKVIIDVADNGAGIAPENLKKIFEPFFTTKPIGSGTGLGLSIVYKIIEQHNGTITVDSEVGKGTTFRITLPLAVAKQQRVSMFADE
ncbi:histidine kinase [Chloroherpeton thalassium ATCC 35110]|uniref:histidine kinase n=2 Tax=Chloroherpeton thalassium TaxID=100716 RepID=B3QWZ7_CHLT3|nr:histidine kinase [Chloroherpeton thalassium ATCC 35110]